MKHIFLLLTLSAVFFSCSHKAEHVERAFYYWKNNSYSLEDNEKERLDSLRVNKIYLKFFEVEKNIGLGIIPVAKKQLSLNYQGNDSLTIIPVVYLRNEVFKNISKSEIDSLAGNVNFLIDKYCEESFNKNPKVTEYQMDCDWTPSTRDSYFYFLKKLKGISKKKISCTLRLYPFKYADKMGVPPVDSAMLMCYNLINPLKNHDRNSILDINELAAYLGDYDYPLHLDIALPVYSWMQVYQNNHFTHVIYTNTKDVRKILKPEKPLWYEVTKDTVINEFYLRIGDKVKIEEMEPAQLQKAITLITKKLPLDKQITVSLFHLDGEQLSRYTNEELSAIYSGFTKQ